VPHSFSYIWRYGAQRRGVDGRPGESWSWPSVKARLVSVQERLRGWPCGDFPFGRRPYVDSGAQLTGGRKAHNNRRGGISSS
jgi:hypothetical protein